MLKGIDFPRTRDELVDSVGDDARQEREILERLPDREYRDAADVARNAPGYGGKWTGWR